MNFRNLMKSKRIKQKQVNSKPNWAARQFHHHQDLVMGSSVFPSFCIPRIQKDQQPPSAPLGAARSRHVLAEGWPGPLAKHMRTCSSLGLGWWGSERSRRGGAEQ